MLELRDFRAVSHQTSHGSLSVNDDISGLEEHTDLGRAGYAPQAICVGAVGSNAVDPRRSALEGRRYFSNYCRWDAIERPQQKEKIHRRERIIEGSAPGRRKRATVAHRGIPSCDEMI